MVMLPDTELQDQGARSRDSAGLLCGLPPDLLHRIAALLPRNDIPLKLRLVNKRLASMLSQPQHHTVQLSQPVAPRDFAARWGSPKATQRLTLRQRFALLRLTAASGVVSNFLLLHKQNSFQRLCSVYDGDSECAGTPLHECLWAAAAAGRVDMCELLTQRGFVCTISKGYREAMGVAAAAGQPDVFRLLLKRTGLWAHGSVWIWPDILVPSLHLGFRDLRVVHGAYSYMRVQVAAKHGFEAVMEWLLQQQGNPLVCAWDADWPEWPGHLPPLAQVVAESCSLAFLQHFLLNWHHEEGSDVGVEGASAAAAAAAAAAARAAAAGGSGAAATAAAWPAEGGGIVVRRPLGGRREALQGALQGAAACPAADWCDKVAWLLMLEEQQLPGALDRQHKRDACVAAARREDAGRRLRWLAHRGLPVACSEVACEAVRHGRMEAVLYLLDELGAVLEREVVDWAMTGAAEGGHLPVLQAMYERGYGVPTWAAACAVQRGHVQVAEWLLGLLPGPHAQYFTSYTFVDAVREEDWPALRLLLRVGCPRPGETQLGAVAPTVEALEWLSDRACCYPTLLVRILSHVELLRAITACGMQTRKMHKAAVPALCMGRAWGMHACCLLPTGMHTAVHILRP